MTTTKILYVVAAIVPFGCILLACIGIAHVVMAARRERKLQQVVEAAACGHAATV